MPPFLSLTVFFIRFSLPKREREEEEGSSDVVYASLALEEEKRGQLGFSFPTRS